MQPKWIVKAPSAASAHIRKRYFLRRLEIGHRQVRPFKGFGFVGAGEACTAASGTAFERDERYLEVPARAQKLQHIHQLAIGHGAIRTKEDAAILSRLGHAIERPHEISPLDMAFHRRQRQDRL